MNFTDTCPVGQGEARDWCDLGIGLGGIELSLKNRWGASHATARAGSST
jgi:hypothetical protein